MRKEMLEIDTAKIAFTVVLIILAVIVAAGIGMVFMLSAQAEHIDGMVASVIQSVSADEWDIASERVAKLESEWMSKGDRWAMLIDHSEIDNIDTSLQRMSAFIREREKQLALAEASVLIMYIRHIPEKESFRPANIF